MTTRVSTSDVCVYCGSNGILTRDHVPPRNLFPKPRPSDLITVPSCLKCNTSASKDDEFFRQSLLLYKDTLSLPGLDNLASNFMRGLSRPERPGLLADLKERVYVEPKYNPKGDYLGEVFKQEIDAERLDKVARRITKGLFYTRMGQRISDKYFVSAFSTTDNENIPRDLQLVIEKLEAQSATAVGDGSIFTFQQRIFGEDSSISQWLLTFYQKVKFLGFSLPNKPSYKFFSTPYIDF